MSLLKCKMCGGDMAFEENATVATCEYCGTRQTLPKRDNEKRLALFERANLYRRENDYDKAMALFEQVLSEDVTDAEAYWCIVLCKYGVEYVKDYRSGALVPTLNRTQLTPVTADPDYKQAIRYADVSQREIYEREAAQIDRIQKGILDISNKEKPFDVFICYKETDEQGRRTRDSVIANELYHLLTKDGYKVFFAKITLEDKLGTAYEPYIFAALNSAKVMVVLGTRPEYFQAVWVRNEWSRYLKLMQKDKEKILIPAYRDMDPYELPEEFAYLQALDMNKLGFMQDLTQYISKVIKKTTNTPKSGNASEISREAKEPQKEAQIKTTVSIKSDKASEKEPEYTAPRTLREQREAYSDEELIDMIQYKRRERDFLLHRLQKGKKRLTVIGVVSILLTFLAVSWLPPAIAGGSRSTGLISFLTVVIILALSIGVSFPLIALVNSRTLKEYGVPGKTYGDEYEYPDIAKKYFPNQTVKVNKSAQPAINIRKQVGIIVKDLQELEELAKERNLM